MQLSEFSVRRPILITMTYIVILVICGMLVSNLEIALYPNVDMPIIAVMVRNQSEVDPSAAEQQVAKVMEDNLGSIENLNKISTYSSTSTTIAVLEFNYGTNLDDAEDDVNSAISQINGSDSFPDWVSSTTVFRFDRQSNSTFMTLVMEGSDDLDEMKSIAENDVEPLLMRIKDMSQVEINGTGTIEYDVNVDPIKLASYGLTLSDVKSAVAARNVQESVGSITQNNLDYTVTIDERIRNLQDILETKIATIDGVDVFVSDVASVDQSLGDSYRQRYVNDKPTVQLSLSNNSDSNSTTVAKAVKEALPSINEALPNGISVAVLRDDTSMISSTMNAVYQNAIEGVVLAAVVIFLFLRNIKATIIISLSMPISILFTLMAMSLAGITVNSMSMAGLILGIGMIVDASVLNLENTYNFRTAGKSAAASAILGSQDMASANFGSTITTICVFVPLIIFKNDLEMLGIMFQDLIYTVCISLVVSLFVAQTLVPALSGSILRLDSRTQKPLRFRVLRALDKVGDDIEKGLEKGYVVTLRYVLRHRFLFIMLLVLTLCFCFGKIGGIGLSLTPDMRTNDTVTMNLTLASGTTQSVTREKLFAMEQVVIDTLPQEAYTSILVNVGTGNTGSIEIDMPDIADQTYSADDIQSMLRPKMSSDPEAQWIFSRGRGPGSDSAIQIDVTGDDLDLISQSVNEIATIIRTYVPIATDVDTDLENGAPRIRVNVDKEKAHDLGVTMEEVSTTLGYALDGTKATTITTFSDDETYSLYVKIADSEFTHADDIGALLVTGTDGPVALDSFATVDITAGQDTITRVNKKRVNEVTANLAAGHSANEVQAAIDQALAEHFKAPEGITVSNEGQMSQFAGYAPILIAIVLLALLLVFAVMAAQFESLVDPFIIFATIPLLLIGVIAIHIWMNQTFSLFSIVGVVALIGVVVNNGIVLVDTINHRVKKHQPVFEACLDSARTRLRPILMTTLTTVVGMIPLAFFPGEGSEMMQPIALTFVGGLVSGALLTLYLSPVLYSIFNKRREKKYDDPRTLANQLAQFDREQAEEKMKETLAGGAQAPAGGSD